MPLCYRRRRNMIVPDASPVPRMTAASNADGDRWETPVVADRFGEETSQEQKDLAFIAAIAGLVVLGTVIVMALAMQRQEAARQAVERQLIQRADAH